jgi:hypothetical protein
MIAEAMARAEHVACRPGDERCYPLPYGGAEARATCTPKGRCTIADTRRVIVAKGTPGDWGLCGREPSGRLARCAHGRRALATAERVRRHPSETPHPAGRNGVSAFRHMRAHSFGGRARVADDLTPQTRGIACEALSIVSQIEASGGPSGRIAGLETVRERRDVTAAEP